MTRLLHSPVVNADRVRVSRSSIDCGSRAIPEESAVAFTYDRSTYAVMMATPADLEDFAVGFSLTEQIIASAEEIAELDIVQLPLGFELRMALIGDRRTELETRRRRMAGPAGCGLCGIESLESAVRKPATIESYFNIVPENVFCAMRELHDHQLVNAQTRAVHAAGFWSREENCIRAVREDVGRHNALDKLAGALARTRYDAKRGFIALTSRVSIEIVQKAAAIGCPLIAAVSAPTGFAVRAAEEAGLTLIAVARDDSFEVFTHCERIVRP